jgi:hypothetical protein
MTGILKMHGTSPNLFGSGAMSFDESAWEDAADTDLKSTNFITIDEIPSDHSFVHEVAEKRVLTPVEQIKYRKWRKFRQHIDLSTDFEMFEWFISKDDYETAERPYDKYDTLAERYEIKHDGLTTIDDHVENKVVICTLNGEEVSPEAVKEIFCEMTFDDITVPANQSTPSFHGVNRVKIGQIGWWDIDNKDHKTWANRRRSTGLSRAPKWHQFAGGRKLARCSIKTLPVE